MPQFCGNFLIPSNDSGSALARLLGCIYLVTILAAVSASLCVHLRVGASGSLKVHISLIVDILISCSYACKTAFYFMLSRDGPCLGLLVTHMGFYIFLFLGVLLLLYRCFESVRISFIRQRRFHLIRLQRAAFLLLALILAGAMVSYAALNSDPKNVLREVSYSALMILAFSGLAALILVQAIFLRVREPEKYARKRLLYFGMTCYAGLSLIAMVWYVLYNRLGERNRFGNGTLLLNFYFGYIPAAFPSLLVVCYLRLSGINETAYEDMLHSEGSFLTQQRSKQSVTSQSNEAEIRAIESSLIAGNS